MNILLLHNNNVPFSFISEDWGNNISLKIAPLNPTADDEDYDLYVNDELERIFTSNSFDLIVLPYSFSEYNQIEYTGLIVAAHIRLTPEWNHTRKPILFVGAEEVKQVAKLSEMGSLLYTSGLYTTRTNDLINLVKGIKNLPMGEISDADYNEFLKRIIISRPANYATHHSIANEWAIIRWANDVINWNDYEAPITKSKSFTSMLYFKYLMVKVGIRDKFSKTGKKKHGADPKIVGISGKKIVYIDDEYNKGWDMLLSKIFEISGAIFSVYDGFKDHKDRDELISDINTYVDNIDADCYLLDLRLHDDDFDKNKGEISGHKIAAHIKDSKINRARQVVIFSASDKVWNMKEEMQKIGATDYVLKESPESNFSIQDSKKNFEEFKKSIKEACDFSYLKDYVNIMKGTEFERSYSLNNYIDLALLNNEELINTCILDLCLFFEDYTEKNFDLSGSDKIRKIDTGEEYKILGMIKVRFTKDTGGQKKYDKIECLRNIDEQKRYSGWDNADPTKRTTIIFASLFYHYGFNNGVCQQVNELRMERNSVVAHYGEKSKYRFAELRSLFDDVIIKIIQQEESSHL